ncbi:AI-2E family transporter [Chitinophagaceae bacterium IBVUCB1]|nr:AI-2E family transporter [Chitinophagaceae bacterium IBVUCB1]
MIKEPVRILDTLYKYTFVVLGCGLILYWCKDLFVPMFMGLLIAMIMYPVCVNIERRGISKGVAITICLSIVVLVFLALVWLLFWQLSLFWQDVPSIIDKLMLMLPEMQSWMENKWGLSIATQNQWIEMFASNAKQDAGSFISSTFSATASTLFFLFVIPIYSALFLYHRHTFVLFIKSAAGDKRHSKINKILSATTRTYYKYIKGMIMVYIIVGVLNSIGLLALGIKHAVLFGMLTAIMTIVPYVGIIISAMLPISVAFLTKDSLLYPLAVVAVFSFVQYLEANVIFPHVVGVQLNVSTWATLVAIILGGIIWGIAGMILFIPFVAILKIVTDHLEESKSINILLSRKD